MFDESSCFRTFPVFGESYIAFATYSQGLRQYAGQVDMRTWFSDSREMYGYIFFSSLIP